MPSLGNLVKALTNLTPTQRALLGGAAGYGIGHEITPRVLGFRDDPAATNMSTLLDTVTYGTLAGMGRGNIAAALKSNPMAPLSIAAGLAGGQTIPVAMKGLREGTDAAGAATTAFSRPLQPTLSEQAGSVLGSTTARGAGAGAATAGIAAILSGLLRARSDSEVEGGTGRGTMVGKDFLKYLVPALLAGGTIGSFSEGQDRPPSGGLTLR
jgi:hypothetical protein